MTRVKLCGLMSDEDVAMAVRAGADALGFVTEYPVPVPWNLAREQAAELVRRAPPFVTTVAVVGGEVADMIAIARKVRPNFLQLHGDETLAEIEAVVDALRPEGVKVLKALRIDVDSGEAQFPESDPVRAAGILSASGLVGLIVDSKTGSRPAGTGVALDWGVIARLADAVSIPLILAGGLNSGNVAEAVRYVRPYGVDVISGVERASGVKDEALMRTFVKAVKHAGL